MTRHANQPRNRISVKRYAFLSFAKNFEKKT